MCTCCSWKRPAKCTKTIYQGHAGRQVKELDLVCLVDESCLAVGVAQLLLDGDKHHLAHGTVKVILLRKVVDPGSCCGTTKSCVCAKFLPGDGLQVHDSNWDELRRQLIAYILDLVGKFWANFLEDGTDDLVLSVNI